VVAGVLVTVMTSVFENKPVGTILGAMEEKADHSGRAVYGMNCLR
jgi:hypothetical protein